MDDERVQCGSRGSGPPRVLFLLAVAGRDQHELARALQCLVDGGEHRAKKGRAARRRSPTEFELRVAERLGDGVSVDSRSCGIADRTFWRVLSLTFAPGFMTLETVASETPASSATSYMFAIVRLSIPCPPANIT